MKNLNLYLSLIIPAFAVISTMFIPLPVFAPTYTCQGVPATIVGTPGRDTLRGTSGNDVIVGLGDGDVIDGMAGDDLICGDDGSDRLYGGYGNDRIFGGNGNDALLGYIGDDTLSGDAGNDGIYGDVGNDIISGGTGDDQLAGFDGNDIINGDDGNDSIDGGSGTDNCVTGERILNCELGDRGTDPPQDTTPPTVSMTSPPSGQTLTGTITVSADAADDTGVVRVEFYVDGLLIAADTSNDFATPWNTNTVLDGSHSLRAKAYDLAGNIGTSIDTSVIINNVPIVPNEETITCQGVPATIVGTPGRDTLRGTSGNDVIVGLGDGDVIDGMAGDDLICGDDGSDRLYGGYGNDRIFGGNGNDALLGYIGDDTLSGDAGNDGIYGDVGNDIISGGTGDDQLAGFDGNDIINGDDGNDSIDGGSGTDNCIGESVANCEQSIVGETSSKPNEVEAEIHRLVNEERVKVGVQPLQWNERLAEIARQHSFDMRDKNYFNHGNFAEHIRTACSGAAGENIFFGFDIDPVQIAESAVKAWMNSPGHRANILTSSYYSEGLGFAVSETNKIYVTQDFCQ